MQQHLHQLLCDWRAAVHAWTHVNLNQPRIEILIYHKIKTHQLKRTLFWSHIVLTAFNTPDYNILNLLFYFGPIFLPDMLSESSHLPHTILNLAFLVMFLYRIICQMNKPILNIIQWKIIHTESEIAFVIKIYLGRTVILNHHPLPDIKFPPLNQQRFLDIFLYDKLSISS